MLDKHREQYAKKIRRMVERGTARKQVFYQVGRELAAAGLPSSRPTLYRWLAEFEIILR